MDMLYLYRLDRRVFKRNATVRTYFFSELPPRGNEKDVTYHPALDDHTVEFVAAYPRMSDHLASSTARRHAAADAEETKPEASSQLSGCHVLVVPPGASGLNASDTYFAYQQNDVLATHWEIQHMHAFTEEGSLPGSLAMRPPFEAATAAQVLPAGFKVDKREKGLAERFGCLADKRTPLRQADARRLKAVRDTLALEFPWAEKAVGQLLNKSIKLAGLGLSETVDLPNLLLVGRPGTGKSRLAKRAGELLGLPTLQVQLSDPKVLGATAKGWGSATPSAPLDLIARHQVANPLVVVDELEKVDPNGRNNGNALDDLLPLLEKDTARTVFDSCLRVAADLSHVNWIATANSIDRVPGYLLSRFVTVEVGLPQPDHLDALVPSISRDLANDWGLPRELIPALDETEEDYLRQRMSKGASIRAICRMVEHLLLDRLGEEPRPTH